MGFYIHKAFSFGPLRLNLSRSGLGASFGIKGARVGVGPRGSYVHLGRGGLYYRQTLTPASGLSPRSDQSVVQPPISRGLQEITSSAATSLTDSSAQQLLQELNRVKQRIDWMPPILVVGTIVVVLLLSLNFAWWLPLVAGLDIVLFAICARHFDVTNGTVILNYSLVGSAAQEFEKLKTAFQTLSHCAGIWNVDASGSTGDWKRNAGATSLSRRSETRPSFGSPAKVSCNIEVPTLRAQGKYLYFFPDRLLVYDSSGIGAVPYSDLQMQSGQTRFIEKRFRAS